MVCNTVGMGVRWAALSVLAVFVALILTAPRLRSSPAQLGEAPSPRPARRPGPPPMFSPWYAESLSNILTLEESDVARLERKLASNPDDFPTRLKVMAYYQRADRVGHQEARDKRVQHALWLVQHHPESEILHSPVSRFSKGELTPAEYRRVVALWEA